MLAAAVFDIDSTMIASGGVGMRAFSAALAAVAGGDRRLPEDYRPHGKTDPLIFGECFTMVAGRPPTKDEYARIEEIYLERLRLELERGCSDYQILPGVERLIDHLEARGVALGLGTGNIEAGARLKLGPAGLWPRFRFGGFGCDAMHRGEILRAAIRRAGETLGREVSPAEVLFIGDHTRDIEAARHAGGLILAVATGCQSVEELRAADLAVPTLEDPAVYRFIEERISGKNAEAG